jgi:hypothetical protein
MLPPPTDPKFKVDPTEKEFFAKPKEEDAALLATGAFDKPKDDAKAAE